MLVTFPRKKEPEPPEKASTEASGAELRGLDQLKYFAELDHSRYAFGNILVEPAKRRIVATDSRVLIVVTIYEAWGETAFLVDAKTLDSFAQMQRQIQEAGPITAELKGGVVELSFSAPERRYQVTHPLPAGKFPAYEQVLPADDQFAASAVFDARYLKRVVDHAILNKGSGTERVLVKIDLIGPSEVARISCYDECTAHGARAVCHLMPVICDEKYKN